MPAIRAVAASTREHAKLPAGPPLDYCFMDIASLKSGSIFMQNAAKLTDLVTKIR